MKSMIQKTILAALVMVLAAGTSWSGKPGIESGTSDPRIDQPGTDQPPVRPLAEDPPQAPAVLGVKIPYQGFLSENGAPVNATVSVTAALYAAVSGGSALWTETQSVNVADGVFTMTLGALGGLDSNIFTGSPLFLGISIDADPELPRTQLLETPFAIRAREAGHALTADNVTSGQWTESGANVYRPGGNVGIGTSAPAERLDVFGDQRIVSNTDVTPSLGSGALYITNNPATEGLHIDTNEIQCVGRDLLLNNDNGFGTTINNKLFVTTSDFVGVGRSTAITGVERFGVTSPVTSGYGGMYLNTQGSAAWPFYGYATGGTARAWTYYDGGTNIWHMVNGSISRLAVRSDGNVGIGSLNPPHRLDVVHGTGSGLGNVAVHAQHTGSSGVALYAEANSSDAAVVFENDGTGDIVRAFQAGSLKFRVTNTGRVVTPVLEITGGADLVESFETSDEAAEPGTVMVIDPESPGRLRASDGPWDRRVAGVVSGAGGMRPGIRMGQDGMTEGDIPVAMTGRVYVKCSTENGPIVPGDLLTTSSLKGHAMRAGDADCHGAVIGKAMTSLDNGEGLVLVLVNLQ